MIYTKEQIEDEAFNGPENDVLRAMLRQLLEENEALRNAMQWKPIKDAVFDGRAAVIYRPLAHLSVDPQVTLGRLIGGNQYCWDQTVPKGQEAYNPTNRSCHVTHYFDIPSTDGLFVEAVSTPQAS